MFVINGHTPDEWGAIHIHTEIASPEPRIEMLEVPLRDGAINTSAMLSNTVHYNTREIVLGMEVMKLREMWPLVYSAVLKDVHGQAVEVSLDNDPDYFWEGSAMVEPMEDHGATAGITIRIQAQPFKKTRNWKIGPEVSITTSESETISIDAMRAYPEFDASTTGIVMSYNSVSYTLPSGKSTVYGLVFVEGDNDLDFSGPGVVDIRYREGTL